MCVCLFLAVLRTVVLSWWPSRIVCPVGGICVLVCCGVGTVYIVVRLRGCLFAHQRKVCGERFYVVVGRLQTVEVGCGGPGLSSDAPPLPWLPPYLPSFTSVCLRCSRPLGVEARMRTMGVVAVWFVHLISPTNTACSFVTARMKGNVACFSKIKVCRETPRVPARLITSVARCSWLWQCSLPWSSQNVPGPP